MSSSAGIPDRVAEFVKPFNRAERLAGAGCVLVIVSMPLDWKGLSGAASSIPGVSVNGLHGWGFATLLIALATLAFLVARSPLFRNTVALPKLPLADGPLLMAAGAAEALTILLFAGEYGAPRQAKLGFYLALIGAALTAAGGYLALRAAQAYPAGEPAPAPEAPTVRGGGPPCGGGPPV